MNSKEFQVSAMSAALNALDNSNQLILLTGSSIIKGYPVKSSDDLDDQPVYKALYVHMTKEFPETRKAFIRKVKDKASESTTNSIIAAQISLDTNDLFWLKDVEVSPVGSNQSTHLGCLAVDLEQIIGVTIGAQSEA